MSIRTHAGYFEPLLTDRPLDEASRLLAADSHREAKVAAGDRWPILRHRSADAAVAEFDKRFVKRWIRRTSRSSLCRRVNSRMAAFDLPPACSARLRSNKEAGSCRRAA